MYYLQLHIKIIVHVPLLMWVLYPAPMQVMRVAFKILFNSYGTEISQSKWKPTLVLVKGVLCHTTD